MPSGAKGDALLLVLLFLKPINQCEISRSHKIGQVIGGYPPSISLSLLSYISSITKCTEIYGKIWYL